MTLRAAVVGTAFGGRIHVPALRAAGFDVVALVGQDEAGALAPECLGDGIGKTPAVGDPENQRTLPL